MTITPEREAELIRRLMRLAGSSVNTTTAAANDILAALDLISTQREGRAEAEEANATFVIRARDADDLSIKATIRAQNAEAQISALQALIAEKDEALGALITEANRLGPQLPYNAPTKDISDAIERARAALTKGAEPC